MNGTRLLFRLLLSKLQFHRTWLAHSTLFFLNLTAKSLIGECQITTQFKSRLYDTNSAVQTTPSFGLCDHDVVVLRPQARTTHEGQSVKLVSRRDTRVSRKLQLGRYFCSFDRSHVELAKCYDEMLQLLADFIKTGLDIIRPVKSPGLMLMTPHQCHPNSSTSSNYVIRRSLPVILPSVFEPTETQWIANAKTSAPSTMPWKWTI